MKKTLIVILLFGLPIVAYLFFSSGVHSFAKLPVIKEEIGTIDNFTSLNGDKVRFNDHITILGFFGNNLEQNKSGFAFNLNQKIYKKYHPFKDFQFIIAMPQGTQDQVVKLLETLDDIADVNKWKFVFGEEEDVLALHQSLNPDIPLDNNLGTPYVFIIDKEGQLRGRDDSDAEMEPRGYDISSVSELSNKMDDDVKVILAEYRLELKKYNKEQEN